jgi:hypothetical protein
MGEIAHPKLCTSRFELPGRIQVAVARGIGKIRRLAFSCGRIRAEDLSDAADLRTRA